MSIIPNSSLEVPNSLLPWIHYDGYLTEKLRDKAGDARLEVLFHGFGPRDEWDITVLSIADAQVLHREIVITACGVPCWYARTIIPATTYQADETFFERLKTESLGELIFHTTKVLRVERVCYSINENSSEYAWLNASLHGLTKTLWVRRTTFVVSGSFLFFLVEIFLPGLQVYLQ